MLLLLLLLSRVAMVTAVAGCHSDRDKDHRLRQNCTAAGFSDLPPGLDPKTQVLLFPANRFSTLSWTSFQIFPNIYEIDLTANEVPEVTSTTGVVLHSLSVLRLGSNRLTVLLDRSFTACPSLNKLHLENNSIASLSDHTFYGLKKLEILDLTSNHIAVLPDLMMHPLVAIETLYLEVNQIQVVPDDWFSQNEEVQFLYLSANPWRCSCSLGYLRRYMKDYEGNFYVRDGPEVTMSADSVVCASPERHRSKPLVFIAESDLCPAEPVLRGDVLLVPTETPPLTTPPPVETTVGPTAPPPEVVTWVRIQSFTRFHVWSFFSESEGTGGVRKVQPAGIVTPPKVLTWSRSPPTPDLRAPTLTTPTLTIPALMTPSSTVPTPTLTTPSSTVPTPPVSTRAVFGFTSGPARRGGVSVRWVSAAAAGVFCVWLFAGCLLLCTVSAACTLLTVVKMVMWYRGVYTPLAAAARRRGHEERVPLGQMGSEEDAGGAGGVRALYRSVLFIHRDAGEAGATGGVRGEEAGVYRKTMFRLLSREEEVQGWREVMEECRVPSQEGGGRGRGPGEGGGASRKRYSVILREEREGCGGGREELDWVVGGWEVNRGRGEEGEGPRSSWGEWLTHYLPSLPWEVTTPSQMK